VCYDLGRGRERESGVRRRRMVFGGWWRSSCVRCSDQKTSNKELNMILIF